MPTTEFLVWRVADVDVVRIDGALDLAAAVRLRLVLYGRLDAGARRIVVDLSATSFLDAGAVNVLLTIRRRLLERGGSLIAPGARGTVLDVLRMLAADAALAADTAIERALADPGEDVEPATATPHSAWGDDVHELFQRLHALAPHETGAAAAIRQQIVMRCLPSAKRLAARFHRLGEGAEDLDQVAALALVMAVNRYRPQVGADFASYAVPTIVGELKRHLRDKGWAVHVPRRLQELRLEINRAVEDLTHELNRMPTTRELAERVHADESEIRQAQQAMGGRYATSLSEPDNAGGDRALIDRIGVDDSGYTAVDHHESLRVLLRTLPDREREILRLRFFGDMTQTQIAEKVGLSQMHISRLLTRTLAQLRMGLLGYPPDVSLHDNRPVPSPR
jgi:RNA polymerase sigma-B factor